MDGIKFVQTPSLSDETKNRSPSFRRCGYGPCLHICFGVGGTLNSKSLESASMQRLQQQKMLAFTLKKEESLLRLFIKSSLSFEGFILVSSNSIYDTLTGKNIRSVYRGGD